MDFCPLTSLHNTVAITDKIYIKNHRQLASQLETSFPKSAFAGATLDILFTSDGLSQLDDASRDRVLGFVEDFLDCDCDAHPHCGCPERKFIAYLLELRTDGLSPEEIIDVMSDEYLLYAYPGDILTFLDNGIRTLEAAEQLATVEGYTDVAAEIEQTRRELTG